MKKQLFHRKLALSLIHFRHTNYEKQKILPLGSSRIALGSSPAQLHGPANALDHEERNDD